MSKNKESKQEKIRKTSVGGQALIEGVMMNGPKGAALSVRNTKGEIITEFTEIKHARDKVKFLGLPFVRGIVNFIESMIIGYKSLMRSAELSGELEDESDPEKMSKLDKWLNEHMGPKMFAVLSSIASVFAVVIGVGLFVFLPTYLVDIIDKYCFADSLAKLHALFEGLLRAVIIIVYMFAVSQMKEIRRVFMYHGAEHKCINCIEHGLELNVENVMKSSREHKRCGTSFLLIVMVVSIILHMFIRVDSKTLGFVIRILLLPVVAGISYEFIRLAGTSDNRLVALLSKPGMALQHMTTREPGPDMVEVAIASVEAVFDWKKFLNENFGANYELTEQEYVVGETIVPGTEKKSAAQLKKTEEVTA